MKHQIKYKGKSKLVLLYNVPEPPPVMTSIYADTMAMNRFNEKMAFIEKYALNVLNPEVLYGQFYLDENTLFDLPESYRLEIKGNDVTIHEIKN